MDALSEVLRDIRITGALLFNAEYGAPWGFASPASHTYAPLLAPGTEHLVLFHLVTAGEATAAVDGFGEVRLAPGEIVVFPHGDAHTMQNGPVRELSDSSNILPKILSGSLELERGGGGGAATKFICGYFGCERYAERLFLAGLPPLAYLARWRMQLAARLLEMTDRKVLRVAFDVGYESEAAFNRAFKRQFDVPPAQYRRQSRSANVQQLV
jgi:hypothetical protein